MSRSGYEGWDGQFDGRDPYPYDPPEGGRGRRHARTDEEWSQQPPAGDFADRGRAAAGRGGYPADDSYGPGGYGSGGYEAGGYEAGGYEAGGYGRGARDGYADNGYADNGYPDSGYAENGYAGGYEDRGGYADTGYSGNGYSDSGYSGRDRDSTGGRYPAGYTEADYPSGSYPAAGYPAAGYPDGYADPSYPGRGQSGGGYSGGGYQEQSYDTAEPYGGTDPYGRSGPLSRTDPGGRTDPGRQPGASGYDPRGQYAADAYDSGVSGAYGEPDPYAGQGGYASQGGYGEPEGYAGSGGYPGQDPYGQADPYAGPDPYAGRDPYAAADPSAGGDPYAGGGGYAEQDPYGAGHGQAGYGEAGYGEAGYDQGGYDTGAPTGRGTGTQRPEPDYDYTGMVDIAWQSGQDDTGGSARRRPSREDQLDADSSRHDGFFRGFGGHDDDSRRRPSQPRRSRAGMVALFVVVVFLAVAAGGGVYAFHWYKSKHNDFSGAQGAAVTVQVPQGATAFSLASTLVKDGVIATASPFESAAKVSGKSALLEPGFFKLHKHMSGAAAWAALIDPKSRIQLTVTVPDGMRSADVLQLLATKTGIKLSDFQAALKNTSALGLPSWAKGNPEGFLWPATYSFDPGTSAQQILQTMVKQFNTEMAKLNLPAMAAHDHFDNELEVIVEASLLEAEVGPTYYTQVARVIDNRLNQGIDLQLDSTVSFALNKHTDKLTTADEQVNSPYNTFTHAGMPPGPIDSPDLAAIQAVLNPAPKTNDWLFFVTVDKNGTTKFTDSSTEFAQLQQEAQKNGV